MKIVSGDFGDSREATIHCSGGWLGKPRTLKSIEISRRVLLNSHITAAELDEVQLLADDSRTTTKSNVGNAVGGIAVGAVLAGPVGAAIGGLLASGGKLSTSETEKRIAIMVRLKDGRQFFASCDLAEYGLLSTATSKNRR